MCDYTQREFSCGHFRWLASKHCAKYKAANGQTKNVCQPDITAFEERANLCGECRMQQDPPEWLLLYRKRLPASSRR